MNAVWGWDPEKLKEIFEKVANEPKKKFIFTDSQDEFISRMESSAESALKQYGDNLRYLEQMDKIRQVKEGARLEDVYPWLKKDKDNA